MKYLSGINVFHGMLDMRGHECTRSYYNLHPHYASEHVEEFEPARKEHHFLAGDSYRNNETCETMREICEENLSKRNESRGQLMFKIGLFLNRSTMIQLPHIDDS